VGEPVYSGPHSLFRSDIPYLNPLS
jgi:hypothetical protein